MCYRLLKFLIRAATGIFLCVSLVLDTAREKNSKFDDIHLKNIQYRASEQDGCLRGGGRRERRFRVDPFTPSALKLPVRTVTYFSSRKGKRKTVKAVVYRFLRLHSGLWLRRKAGYKKKLWKKTTARKRRLREFVFCNKTQSKLLDKMTTSFWKRRNWYVDDPYLKYHDRTNLKV
uniref:Large ribosomal subunit protein bL35m n=1 Tax=Castor canadensis TaxID=51338 RepID=A0A8C0X862_CASCN